MTFINWQNVSDTLVLKLIKQTEKKNIRTASLSRDATVILLLDLCDATRRRRRSPISFYHFRWSSHEDSTLQGMIPLLRVSYLGISICCLNIWCSEFFLLIICSDLILLQSWMVCVVLRFVIVLLLI